MTKPSLKAWVDVGRSLDPYQRAKQYLSSLPDGEDLLLVLRRRSESAEDLLRDRVFQEAFQAMNEEIVAEIASSEALADRERTVLYLKLQLVSELQQTLMQFIDNYETMAVQREAQERADNLNWERVSNG
jgi:hypothetical protein